MHTRIEKFKLLALCSMLIPTFMFASDRENVDPIPTLLPANPTEEEQVAVDIESGSPLYIFDTYPNVYLPNSAHVLTQISALGDQVELEDGSVWKISAYDSAKAIQWKSNDPLVIMQNTSWFGSYYFRIVNRATGSSILANLFQGPFKGGEYSRYIADIDYSKGQILLTDATHWEVHPSDRANFYEWALSEPVIIGQNADYDSSWNPYWEGILINVRKTKKFIRVHQY